MRAARSWLGLSLAASGCGEAVDPLPAAVPFEVEAVGRAECVEAPRGARIIEGDGYRVEVPRWGLGSEASTCVRPVTVGPLPDGLRVVEALEVLHSEGDGGRLSPELATFAVPPTEGDERFVVLGWDPAAPALELVPSFRSEGEVRALAPASTGLALAAVDRSVKASWFAPTATVTWPTFQAAELEELERQLEERWMGDVDLERSIEVTLLHANATGQDLNRRAVDLLSEVFAARTRPRCEPDPVDGLEAVRRVESLVQLGRVVGRPVDRVPGSHCVGVQIRRFDHPPALTDQQPLRIVYGAYDSHGRPVALETAVELETDAPVESRSERVLETGERELTAILDGSGREMLEVTVRAWAPELAIDGYFEDVERRSAIRASAAMTFDGGLGPWEKRFVRQGSAHRVSWSPELGRPGGAVVLEAAFAEDPSDWPAVSMIRDWAFPPGADRLLVDVRSLEPARFQVRLFPEGGPETIALGWTAAPTEEWLTLEVDVSPWAGRAARIALESIWNPVGESRLLIDNLRVLEAP